MNKRDYPVFILRHKLKKRNCCITRDDQDKAYYTEWSKWGTRAEIKKQNII